MMSEIKIHWKIQRMDEGDVRDPRFAECLLKIEGRIECEGQPAGLVDAHYERLIRHFSTWGMRHLTGTRYMMAAPEALRDSRTPQWPPCVIHDRWNTCYVCGEWVNIEGGEGHADDDGAVHFGCE